MRSHPILALLLSCVFCGTLSAASQQKSPPADHPASKLTNAKPRNSRLLTSDDGLSVIAAALESRGRARSSSDCSHLVHSVYERAGFSYSYASSSDLYRGEPQFRRVFHPQTGDIVTWPGHAGIVVNPTQHTFFSSLSAGAGVESYSAPYWKSRGTARFYRYIKPPATKLALTRKAKPSPALRETSTTNSTTEN